MNFQCAWLWHDDEDVFISLMRVLLKEHSHEIPNKIIILIYKGLVS